MAAHRGSGHLGAAPVDLLSTPIWSRKQGCKLSRPLSRHQGRLGLSVEGSLSTPSWRRKYACTSFCAIQIVTLVLADRELPFEGRLACIGITSALSSALFTANSYSQLTPINPVCVQWKITGVAGSRSVPESMLMRQSIYRTNRKNNRS